MSEDYSVNQRFLDTVTWARERIDEFERRKARALKRIVWSAGAFAILVLLLLYVGDSSLRWNRAEAVVGEMGVGLVMLAGLIGFVVLLVDFNLLRGLHQEAKLPYQRLAEHNVRYVRGSASQPSRLVRAETQEPIPLRETWAEESARNRQSAKRRVREDPREQRIVEYKASLDEQHEQLAMLDARRWWLWAAVGVPLYAGIPALWLDRRLDEILGEIGEGGLILAAVGVIVASVWLMADYWKRRTLTSRIRAGERALSTDYGLRYSQAFGRDESTLYDRRSHERWYPRSKTREMQ